MKAVKFGPMDHVRIGAIRLPLFLEKEHVFSGSHGSMIIAQNKSQACLM